MAVSPTIGSLGQVSVEPLEGSPPRICRGGLVIGVPSVAVKPVSCFAVSHDLRRRRSLGSRCS